MQKIEVIENFFSDKEIKTIKDYAEDLLEEKDILMSSKSVWEKGLNTSDSDILIYPMDQSIDDEIYDIIIKKMENKFNMKVKACNFFFYKNQSHINWHDDHLHGGGATVYLNKRWDRDYGGFFVYEKDKNFGIELPKFNKCVFQSGSVEHATTPTSLNAPVRKILQVFFK